MREQNWSIVFGQPLEALRSAWEARPGGVVIAAGPGVELQKAPLVSAQEKALHDTGRYVRALVASGKGTPEPRENAKNELLYRDTFQFLDGLGAVPITILADLNITPHLPLAVRSAIDVGGQFTSCDMLCACRTWEQNRCGACESNQQTRTL